MKEINIKKTNAKISNLKTLLKKDAESFWNFLLTHENESQWTNQEAWNWAVAFANNNIAPKITA